MLSCIEHWTKPVTHEMPVTHGTPVTTRGGLSCVITHHLATLTLHWVYTINSTWLSLIFALTDGKSADSAHLMMPPLSHNYHAWNIMNKLPVIHGMPITHGTPVTRGTPATHGTPATLPPRMPTMHGTPVVHETPCMVHCESQSLNDFFYLTFVECCRLTGMHSMHERHSMHDRRSMRGDEHSMCDGDGIPCVCVRKGI